ncbi:MAG: ribonuclease Z [Gemmataceae bacterium]|nr:ribonuclease Z [Gemmataceae bacterium]
MARVTFLGVGAAVPGPGQTNCAYLIDLPGACLLFDCGPAILQQFAAVGRSPGEVTHLFVSHAHGDHALGWPMFALWWRLERKGEGPQVIASAVTWNHLQGLWLHSYGDIDSLKFPLVEAKDGSEHDLGAFRLKTAAMIHSTTFPVLGCRIEAEGKALAFTGDTARTDAVVKLAKGAALLVHDARHGATVAPLSPIQSTWHTTARDAGENAAKAKAKKLALVHIGAEYIGKEADLVKEAKTMFKGEVFAPKGGEVVEA